MKSTDELLIEFKGLINAYAHELSYGDNFDDLVQEGAIGLMKASKKDDGQHPSFGAYASTYIRYAMIDYLQKDQRVSISRKRSTLANKVRKAARQLEETGTPVTVEAVSAQAEISEEDVIDYWDFYDQIPLDFVTAGGDPIIELIPTPDGGIERAERRICLEQLFQILSDKQRIILTLSLKDLSNGEIGECMDLTTDQVKYAKYEAIKRLERFVAKEGLVSF